MEFKYIRHTSKVFMHITHLQMNYRAFFFFSVASI